VLNGFTAVLVVEAVFFVLFTNNSEICIETVV